MMKTNTIIMLLILLAACAPAEKPIEPIKLGATLTLTGFASETGENARKGIELAVEQVNAEGGINGAPLQVLYEDIKEIDLKTAASAAHKFTEVDKVKVILTEWTDDSEVVWPIAAAKNTITLSIAAGAKDLTKKSPLLFRVWPSDENFVNAVVDYAVAQGAQSAATISESDAYYTSIEKITEEAWEQKTGKKLFAQIIAPGATDVHTELLKIKQANPDVLIINTYAPTGTILKQAKELGIKTLLIGPHDSDTLSSVMSIGDAAEGLIYPVYEPSTPEFAKIFKNKYGSEPGSPADTAYDAVIILAKVMREYGTTTEAIQNGLHAVKDFQGASGTITIDETGDRLGRNAILEKIQNGKDVVLS